MAAFAAACEAGYGIELDLQMTADGEIVVVHDGDLMRVAGDPRRIADLTYDELTRIPLFPTDAPGAAVAAPLPGSLENPPLVTTPDSAPEGYFQHVPLFADVLKVVAGRVPADRRIQVRRPIPSGVRAMSSSWKRATRCCRPIPARM